MSPKSSEEKMLQSISEELGVPNLLEILSTTPMRRLQPVLIHAWRSRVAKKKATDLLTEYESKLEFFGTSSIEQNELFDFARMCYAAIPQNFDIVQMSPIAPVGLNAILSKISQDKTMSTIRGSEVVGDVTTQLALECAHRRKKDLLTESSGDVVSLCSSGRVLRLQPFDKNKGYMQHFNLFALCSGGVNPVGGFAMPWLQTHISILLDALQNLQKNGYKFKDLSVKVSDMRFFEQVASSLNIPLGEIPRHSLDEDFNVFREYQVKFPSEIDDVSALSSDDFLKNGLPDRTKHFSGLEKRIIKPLRSRYPGVRFCFDFTRICGLGYYPQLCFHIFANDQENRSVQLADGGAVDWLAKLLNNRKEAMVTSGIGSELIQKLFSPKGESD